MGPLAATFALAVSLALPLQGDVDAQWEVRGCDHGHGYREASQGLRAALRHHQPLTRQHGRRAWHFVLCVKDREDTARLRGERRNWLGWRRSYEHVWPIRLAALPAGWVAWARGITFRESRWDQHACDYVSCTHYSYFQWALSTWYDAGGTGHPYQASWPHQAVLAIRYALSGHLSAWAATTP